jgi:DNA-binding CsgD family transcriptional regulator
MTIYLTPAQKRIMKSMDEENLTEKEVGAKFGISPRTVEGHCRNINKMFGTHKIYESIAIAKQKNLL